ncbi:MAG: D-alanine--D-alanine ligase [Planctomycetes bacterium]|nr:D-alanine--D-alanine ligase [Planctomycetota bacterium]
MPTILVLMGGPDAERDVSLKSGAEVAGALRATPEMNVVERVIDAPSAEELGEIVREVRADAVFPVLHGRWGEGGALQERLETLGVPYVGSGPAASATAMDKMRTKALLADEGVRTPEAAVIDAGDACPLEPPLVLKPNDDGSSVDLRICRSREEVEAARRVLHVGRGRLLAERYVSGRELTVGVVAGETLPVIEIVPAVEFYDYEAKYTRADTRYVLEPDLPAGVADQIRRDTMRAWERLGCRDVARADYMLDDDGAWFLEINTMPGFTTHSLVPMAARRAGRDLPALCRNLATAALGRKSGSGLVPGRT